MAPPIHCTLGFSLRVMMMEIRLVYFDDDNDDNIDDDDDYDDNNDYIDGNC